MKICPHCGEHAHTLECKPMLYAQIAELQNQLERLKNEVRAQLAALGVSKEGTVGPIGVELLRRERDEARATLVRNYEELHQQYQQTLAELAEVQELADQWKADYRTVNDALVAAQRETMDARRCGTCADFDRFIALPDLGICTSQTSQCACASAGNEHDNAMCWKADHGCPHWREKVMP